MENATPATTDQRFSQLAELFSAYPEVRGPAEALMRPMFGCTAQLRVGDKIFAMLVDGRLVLKLPRDQVAALVAAGEAEPFRNGRGQPMKEWASITPHAQADWAALAHQAMAFVAPGA
ncbi:TfoX/Sxy family protein [Chloroflexia bacterium SDU3-3]|nr:TfoX/Sxy family protein [Chloroflexia bacterium SDU3-3]